MIMNKFKLDDDHEYLAEDFIEGFFINPFLLPESIPNSPFIIRTDHMFSVHYHSNGCVRCIGIFDHLDAAIQCAKLGPHWRIRSVLSAVIKPL